MLLSLCLMANTCHMHPYIAIENARSEAIICNISISRPDEKSRLSFLTDTIKSKSTYIFFDTKYLKPHCAGQPEYANSDVGITYVDILCEEEVYERAYFYPKFRRLSKNRREKLGILLTTIQGDTIFYKESSAEKILDKEVGFFYQQIH